MEYKIIANPAAGRGKSTAIVQQIEGMLRERKVKFDIALTKAPGDATDLARVAAAEGWPVIVSLGGDDTISIVGEIRKVSFSLTFPQMYRDSGVKHPALSRHRSSVVKIFTEEPLEKMFDGNIKGRTPLKARILPKAVEILIPSPVTGIG